MSWYDAISEGISDAATYANELGDSVMSYVNPTLEGMQNFTDKVGNIMSLGDSIGIPGMDNAISYVNKAGDKVYTTQKALDKVKLKRDKMLSSVKKTMGDKSTDRYGKKKKKKTKTSTSRRNRRRAGNSSQASESVSSAARTRRGRS